MMLTAAARTVGFVVVIALPAAAPAFAHHSFGVVYDANQPVTLTGTVTKLEWTNPHAHLVIDVKDSSGKVVAWTLEGYPATVLARTGWKRDETVKPGDTITIFGWKARDGSPLAHLRQATLQDGRKLFFGPPAGTGEGAATVR
jgi:Family of unknown function (DUF6152)